MQNVLVPPFLAPIPVGHRVQVIRASQWLSSLFGGPPSWSDVPEPIVIDRDTA